MTVIGSGQKINPYISLSHAFRKSRKGQRSFALFMPIQAKYGVRSGNRSTARAPESDRGFHTPSFDYAGRSEPDLTSQGSSV